MIIIYTKSKEKTVKSVSLKKSIPVVQSKDTIAIINISGPIRLSLQPQKFITYDAETITHKLREFSERSEIKAIILRINSPGGSVAAVQEIYSEILRARQNGKVVIASMGDVSASGGYYIASACDKIVANPGTITGSIGVLLELSNVDGLFKKIGIKTEIIKSGKYKDSGSPFRELTADERKIFQELIDESYNQFINSIVEGRKMKKEDVLPIADGRILSGRQAYEKGLVDMLGNDFDAIELAKKLANIKGKPKIITELTPLDRIINIFSEPSNKSSIQEMFNMKKIRLEYILE
jgi:protease-4